MYLYLTAQFVVKLIITGVVLTAEMILIGALGLPLSAFFGTAVWPVVRIIYSSQPAPTHLKQSNNQHRLLFASALLSSLSEHQMLRHGVASTLMRR